MIRVQRPFYFRGRIPLSKSWLNRALILRSIHSQLRILDWEPSEQDGADVLALDHALKDLAAGQNEFFIGESGTGLRFLLARLSIEKGKFTVRGTEKLLSRPHHELFRVLNKLACQVDAISSTELSVQANGWPSNVTSIKVASDESSQFVSSLMLAATHREHGLAIEFQDPVSAGYIEMTQDLVDQVIVKGRRVLVPEADASSCATLAAIVSASDRKENLDFVRNEIQFLRDQVDKTKQPDRVFFDLIRNLYAPIEYGQAPTSTNPISPGSALSSTPMDVSLRTAPDLFPILAALGALQVGGVRLSGAPHLRHKESDRIHEMAKLLRLVGIAVEERPDGIETSPVSFEVKNQWRLRTKLGFPYIFQPPSDHRLAFAATVLAAAGVPIEIRGRGMVAKSFPAFWSIVEGDGPKVALIGHRGTGKTEASRRWAHLLGARATAVDLDREIERLCGRSVRELFEQDGEGEFRWYERKAFREMDDESRRRVGAFIVACGAGFDASKIDSSWTKIWLRRSTDEDGRIFFGRPRLDPDVSAIAESRKRYSERDPKFAVAADRVFDLAEGGQDPAEQFWVRDLFDEDSVSAIGGSVSLTPEMNLGAAIERYLRWGVARLEVRDDLFSHEEFGLVWEKLTEIPAERLVVSFRNPRQVDQTIGFLERLVEQKSFSGVTIDWSFETTKELPSQLQKLLRNPAVDFIASWHGEFKRLDLPWLVELETKLSSQLGLRGGRSRLSMKLAPTIETFDQLRVIHEWVCQSPSSRVFLPMSVTQRRGRWAWYRLLRGARVPMGLAFWRDGNGTAADQPTFSQWWRRERFGDVKKFAAVVGDPIHHSRTPLEHDSFFTSRGMPIFAIEVSREEAATALPFLSELGLSAVAITSPLKEVAAKGLSLSEDSAINTAVRKVDGWIATSTDAAGLKALWEEARTSYPQIDFHGAIVLWGGGGIKSTVRDIVPSAIHLRASLGPDARELAEVPQPEVIIWASGHERGEWPKTWKPKLFVDLSYTDDSAARALAIELGAKYISGLTMFHQQAAEQREFWRVHLGE